ncbi:MAG: DNA-directed RNA polymerase subunit omega [Treponemataceae bacterium]
MIFPLNELIEYEDNIYEVTCAATRRADQLASLQASDEIDQKINVVSEAAREIFLKEIEYQLPQETV